MENENKMKDYLHPLRALHGRLHDWMEEVFPFYRERFRNPKALYLVYTPEHRNLGDHAIAKSEIQVLNELRIPYIEITGHTLGEWRKRDLLGVMNGRTILINGGGNLGTIWPDIEDTIRAIIIKNPRSRILIFPSTFFYDSDNNGMLELKKSEEIYNSHKNLIIYARERQSYENMKNVYRSVSLAPDMVFRLNECKSGITRHGGIICLRTDREKTLLPQDEIIIREQMQSLFGEDVIDLDMLKSYSIPVAKREYELKKQFDAFRQAKLVVTDRLHGMIFCAISGTPCIVINSKSPKVRGCYEWIKDLPYIRFCDDPSKIIDNYTIIPEKEWFYDNSKILPLFEPLKRDIKRVARRRLLCL